MSKIINMKFIKSFLFGITGLFCFATVLSLLIPSHIKVSRTILINADREKIHHSIALLQNWQNWNPLFKNDSIKIVYTKPDSSACEIIKNEQRSELVFLAKDSTSVKFKLQSKGEDEIQNEIILSSIPHQSAIQVEWRSDTKLKWYPWEKFYGIFIDKLTGPGYEMSLQALKNYLEK